MLIRMWLVRDARVVQIHLRTGFFHDSDVDSNSNVCSQQEVFSLIKQSVETVELLLSSGDSEVAGYIERRSRLFSCWTEVVQVLTVFHKEIEMEPLPRMRLVVRPNSKASKNCPVIPRKKVVTHHGDSVPLLYSTLRPRQTTQSTQQQHLLRQPELGTLYLDHGNVTSTPTPVSSLLTSFRSCSIRN